jgi:hypothetical protein
VSWKPALEILLGDRCATSEFATVSVRRLSARRRFSAARLRFGPMELWSLSARIASRAICILVLGAARVRHGRSFLDPKEHLPAVGSARTISSAPTEQEASANVEIWK